MEVRRHDGGTVLVKDIQPAAAYRRATARPSLTAVGGTLFFAADDGDHGRELWKSDGTTAGTVAGQGHPPRRVRQLEPERLTAVGGTLFFAADDGTHGRELWTSDGTEAGTDAGQGHPPRRTGTQQPRLVTDVGGTLFFTADDGVHGRELWKSDGTEAGTVLVKDINPGRRTTATPPAHRRRRRRCSSSPTTAPTATSCGSPTAPRPAPSWSRTSRRTTRYTVLRYAHRVGGRLFFAADDGIRRRELWRSDGTQAGTVLVEDINLGGKFSVATRGTANTGTGTMSVPVTVAGAGTLVGIGGQQLARADGGARDRLGRRTSITLKPDPCRA